MFQMFKLKSNSMKCNEHLFGIKEHRHATVFFYENNPAIY